MLNHLQRRNPRLPEVYVTPTPPPVGKQRPQGHVAPSSPPFLLTVEKTHVTVAVGVTG